MAKKKYKMQEAECIVCGEPFRRSAPIDIPPKFCRMECRNIHNVGIGYTKYVIPEEYYDSIRKMYANGVGCGQVNRMAKRLGVPRGSITALARKRGWLPKNTRHGNQYYWSDREIQIVENTGHMSAMSAVRRLKKEGFNRGVSAVETKRRQLRVCRNRPGVTANQLAESMGVDVHNILAAIKRGKLKASKRITNDDFPPYIIKDKDIKNYIIEWLPEINITYCDKFWLVDILSG